MKKQKRRNTIRAKPTANKLSVLHQLCNFNLGYLVSKLPRKHGVDQSLRDRTIDVTAGEQAELEVFQHVSLCHIKYLLKPLKFVKVFFLGRSLFLDLTIRRFGRSFF